MSDEPKLLQFKPRQPEDEARPPVIRKPKEYEGCKHRYAEVDQELWRLECQDCHEVLDPIQFLLTVVAAYEMRDYKFQKIAEFEAKEERLRQRRIAKSITQKIKKSYQNHPRG